MACNRMRYTWFDCRFAKARLISYSLEGVEPYLIFTGVPNLRCYYTFLDYELLDLVARN